MENGLRGIVNKNLLAVTAATTARDAIAVMEEHRFRHLAVVSGTTQKIIGMVSRRDLEGALIDPNRPVMSLLSYPIVVASENDTLRHTILQMLEKKVSSILVVNEENEAVGIVTTDDLLWEFASRLKEEPGTLKSLLNFSNMQLVGAVAHQLSQAGI